ncbi:MAG: methionyl-tRNA formyltransferase [Patescibacteria group bacterium]
MELEIKKDNDPVLREPTEEVTDFGFEFQKLVDDITETMRAKEGVGLAAPQVGVSKKMFICEFAGDKETKLDAFPLTVLCNPKIEKLSKQKKNMVEGCLSVPDREIIVKRPKTATVSGKDRYGKDLTIEAESLYARVLQHEVDHLNATLIVDHIKQSKVIFIGTGSLGVGALKSLVADNQYEIVLVVTGAASGKVRGAEVEKNQIYKIAEEAKLPIIRTEKIRDEAIIKKIKKAKPELGIMADFGQIIPQEVLNIPRHGIINIHPSLLPKHRGASPIQQTILDGDKETGLTLILANAECDAGDIISQAVVELSGSETTSILKKYFSEISGSYLLSILPYYLSKELKPHPQPEKDITMTRMFTKEDGFVDEKTPAEAVERKIRAFDEWPKVYTEFKGKKIQLLAAHFNEEGRLIIDRVKPEGKKEMTYHDFQNGYHSDLTFGS